MRWEGARHGAAFLMCAPSLHTVGGGGGRRGPGRSPPRRCRKPAPSASAPCAPSTASEPCETHAPRRPPPRVSGVWLQICESSGSTGSRALHGFVPARPAPTGRSPGGWKAEDLKLCPQDHPPSCWSPGQTVDAAGAVGERLQEPRPGCGGGSVA